MTRRAFIRESLAICKAELCGFVGQKAQGVPVYTHFVMRDDIGHAPTRPALSCCSGMLIALAYTHWINN
jgi:hypothetical protein